MNDKEDHKQNAIWQVNPAQEDEEILTCISLTKTRYCLNEHEDKEDWINDPE